MSKLESQYTPVDSIPKIASSLRTTFASNKTKPLEYRLTQLRKLYWAYGGFSSLPWPNMTDATI